MIKVIYVLGFFACFSFLVVMILSTSKKNFDDLTSTQMKVSYEELGEVNFFKEMRLLPFIEVWADEEKRFDIFKYNQPKEGNLYFREQAAQIDYVKLSKYIKIQFVVKFKDKEIKYVTIDYTDCKHEYFKDLPTTDY